MRKRGMLTICSVLTAVVALFGSTLNVSALPYDSYQYDRHDQAVAVTPACEPLKSQTMFGEYTLNEPQDLHVTKDGTMFIADTKNNRILVLNKDLRDEKVIETFGGGDTFSEPEGITVDPHGMIYVADTGNKRIVVLNQDWQLDRILGEVSANVLPADFDYKPSKIAVDDAGRIFVVVRNFNMGLIELSPEGQFVTTLGAPRVTYTFGEILRRMFATKEQRAKMLSFVPAQYNNVSLDDEGFIFVTTSSGQKTVPKSQTPVRRLNAKGNDVLTRVGYPVGDLIKASVIVDVCPMAYQMYAILDQSRGRVFLYNKDGEAVFLFGGNGVLQGTADVVTAMGYYNESFYLLDAGKASVTVFGLTEYGKMLILAQKYRFEGNFAAEKVAWETVYSMNENSQIVLSQLAKIAYKQRDMVTAMKYARQAYDTDTYSKAFQFYRRDFINSHATWLFLGAVAMVLVILGLRKLYRRLVPAHEPGALSYAKHVIFHPMDGFWDLKYEKRGNMKAALTIYVGVCLVMVLSGQFSGFIVNAEQPAISTSLLTVLLPCLLWCVAIRCVTSLMDGEGNTKEIIIATGYSLTPLIPIQLIAMILSNVMISAELDFYSMLLSIGLIWVLWLVICSVKQTHNYSMSKTVAVILISLLVIGIILFLAMLGFALLQQMAVFVKDFFDEAKLHT